MCALLLLSGGSGDRDCDVRLGLISLPAQADRVDDTESSDSSWLCVGCFISSPTCDRR